MPIRPRNDVPRLSGRRDSTGTRQGREPQTVFRRFFDLIERLDRGAHPEAPGTKSQSPDQRGGRK